MLLNSLLSLLPFLVAVPVYGSPAQGAAYRDFATRNYNTINSIYNVTVYPNNLPFHKIGAAGVPGGLFSPSAAGRVSPLGNFTNEKESAEYFYALAPTRNAPLYLYFARAEIVSFSSECAQVASSIVYFRTYQKTPKQTSPRYVSTLKQIAFWRFDDDGALLNYDAFIPNLGAFVNAQDGLPRADSVLPVGEQRASIQDELCPAIQAACTGDNQVYKSTADCIRTLDGKDYGNWDELWGDDIVCRTVHVILAGIDPIVHCPHVGPTGGSKCSDVVYNNVYFDDARLFGRPEGTTFMCPKNSYS